MVDDEAAPPPDSPNLRSKTPRLISTCRDAAVLQAASRVMVALLNRGQNTYTHAERRFRERAARRVINRELAIRWRGHSARISLSFRAACVQKYSARPRAAR